MRIVTITDEGGAVVTSFLLTDGAQILVTTVAAADFIREQIRKVNGQCNICLIVARSSELWKGRCKNVGCDVNEATRALMASNTESGSLWSSIVLKSHLGLARLITEANGGDLNDHDEPDDPTSPMAGW